MPQWAAVSGSQLDPEFRDNKNFDVPFGLEVSNSTLEVGINTVKYSYQLKDFQEGHVILSNRTVHSAANCSLIQVAEDQYWRWDNWDRTGPFST